MKKVLIAVLTIVTVFVILFCYVRGTSANTNDSNVESTSTTVVEDTIDAAQTELLTNYIINNDRYFHYHYEIEHGGRIEIARIIGNPFDGSGAFIQYRVFGIDMLYGNEYEACFGLVSVPEGETVY